MTLRRFALMGKLASLLAAVLIIGCQGAIPQPTTTAIPATATDAPPTLTPTAIVIEVEPVTDTPVPTATAEGSATPEATPIPEGAITAETVAEVEVMRTKQVSTSVLTAADFSPNSALFAVMGFDKRVYVYNAEDLSKKFEMIGHGDYGFAMAWSPDGALLATGGGFQMMLWDMESGQRVSSTSVRPKQPYRIAWSPDSEQVAVVGGGTSSHLEIIGRGGGLLEDVQINQSVVWGVDYSSTGLMAISNGAGHMIILDADTYEVVHDLYAGPTAWDLAFSPDGSRLAACFSGGSVAMYDTANWSELWMNTGHPRSDCSDGAWTHTGDLYFSGGGDGALIGWDPETGGQRMVRSLTRFIWGIGLSHDDRFIVTAMDNGEVHILGLP